jgi:hypothetical protein
MSFTHWLSNHLGLSPRPASRRNTPAVRPTLRPTLEALEDRWVPSTLTVLNNLDSGAFSLRAEIAAAHNGDTIGFDSTYFSSARTITLTSGELLIKHSITIAGPGASNLTVSGNKASRVFEVGNGAKATLSGLTISNGVVNGNGGGILNNGTLTVSSIILSGNTATGASGYGGGIFNVGTLTVSTSILSSNSAISGGGIKNGGTLTVSGSILSGNSASRGGGISNVGTLTVSGSTLSGNSATEGGGGIWSGVGTLTVKNSSSITGNTAPAGFGADVYNLGVLYLDSTSTIGVLDGNPWVPI